MCIVIVVVNDPCKNVIKTSLISCILCLRILIRSFIYFSVLLSFVGVPKIHLVLR